MREKAGPHGGEGAASVLIALGIVSLSPRTDGM
jgi:hypothetical protein